MHGGDLAPRVRPVVKVLFVINDLARAGAEKQGVLLARGLKSLGWTVSMVLIKERNDFADQLADASIPVTSLNRRGPFDLAVVARLRQAIKRAAPEVVVSLLFLANQLTVLAVSILKRRPAIVVSVRSSYRDTLTPWQRLVARIAHQGADLTLFNSMTAMREEQLRFPRVSPAAYLPNSVVSASTAAVNWPEVGINSGPVVLSVGQLEPVKGHRMLIEAFAAAHPSTAGARLVLIGDGPERATLCALTEARGLLNSVTFLGHRKDPLPFVAAADVFVQPSLSEGMSNALLEAMSLGRCIVATRVGAAPDLLEDGVQALLAPPSVPGLSGALQRALGDPELRARLGEAARKRAEDFSVERIAAELHVILMDVLRRRPTGA